MTLNVATRSDCCDLLTTGPQKSFVDFAVEPVWFGGWEGPLCTIRRPFNAPSKLRAQGSIYTRLMTELNVSEPTLIAWSHQQHQFEIQNLRAIELEAKGLAATTDRVNHLGGQLQRVAAELGERDLTTLTTPQLFALARSLRWQIEQLLAPAQVHAPDGAEPRRREPRSSPRLAPVARHCLTSFTVTSPLFGKGKVK